MGQQGAADEAAWGTNIRVKQAERRFKNVGTHFAQGRVRLFRAVMECVVSINERVYAIDEEDKDWSISPKEAKEYMNRIRVVIEPKSISDLNADVQAAEGMERLKVPKRVIYEDVLGYQQPVELMLERVLEDAQFDPNSPLFQQTMDLIIKRAALMQEAEDSATQQDIQGAMGNVGPGAQQAVLDLLGQGDMGGAIPLGAPMGGNGFQPETIPPASPATQVQMKTGRQQGRQPRPERLPGPAPRY
jgi:hypothetical protein